MHRAHRIPYDRAVDLVGGKIVEIGNMFHTLPFDSRKRSTTRRWPYCGWPAVISLNRPR